MMKNKIQSFGRIAWSVLKTTWWALLLVGGVVVAFLLYRKSQGLEEKSISTFSDRAKDNIENALIDLKIEKVVLQAKSEEQRNQLRFIQDIQDAPARRKELARFLNDRI
jgi:hypothetical protein